MATNHGNKEVKRLFREIEKLGFTVVHMKNNYKIYPPNKDGRVYITHGTPKAVKAIYADFRKLYGVELDPLWKDKK
jgi:acetolactate synthase regulatory subunit